MKTNQRARKVCQIRLWSGLAAVLLLLLAEFGMVCRFGHQCGQIMAPPTNEAPGLGDLLAAR